MRTCNKCDETKPLTSFRKDKRIKSGYNCKCKACFKIDEAAYYQANRAEKIAKRAIYRENNLDKISEAGSKYYIANKVKIREYQSEYGRENRHIFNAKGMKRYAAKLNASPSWVTKEEHEAIKELYKEAQEKGMHVDHIVPLQGKNVCGLHVLANLQLLSPTDNLSKSNKF